MFNSLYKLRPMPYENLLLIALNKNLLTSNNTTQNIFQDQFSKNHQSSSIPSRSPFNHPLTIPAPQMQFSAIILTVFASALAVQAQSGCPQGWSFISTRCIAWNVRLDSCLSNVGTAIGYAVACPGGCNNGKC